MLRTRALPCVLTFLLAFGIYWSNGDFLGSSDSAPNSVLVFSVLERGKLDLDEFRGSYLAAKSGQFNFTEGANGHVTSLFPIGSAIVAAPVYLAIYVLHGAPAITSPSFEPERRIDEKLAASIIASAAAVMLLLCALEFASLPAALLVTAIFAFGSSMWTIASQGLWQHGPVNLLVLVMTFALLRSPRMGWMALAGLCAGLLTVVRPTTIVFGIAALAFVALYQRKFAPAFLLALAVGALPGVAWNEYFFHSLLGGYASDARLLSASGFLSSLAGLLISPSRGLFVFTPVFALSLFGLARILRSEEPRERLVLSLGCACIALIVIYAFYPLWWGGWTYGPRFLTDVAGVFSLLLLWVPTTALMIPLAVCSLAVQAAGAFSSSAGLDWNDVPNDVDFMPARLWAVSDSQIERNALATYERICCWSLASTPGYVSGFAAEVTQLSESGATIVNSGQVPLYGYASGIFAGQARVRVRLLDGNGNVASTQYLYLESNANPHDSAHAVGALTAPRRADYAVLADVIANAESAPAGRVSNWACAGNQMHCLIRR